MTANPFLAFLLPSKMPAYHQIQRRWYR